MNDRDIVPPAALDAILEETARIGFTMACERQTGSLLRTLAASKPGGRLLELGTGTGVGTSWLLAGMDSSARLESVDNDPAVQAVARRHLDADARVTFHRADAADFLAQSPPSRFDLVYADAWAGKFSHLELALGQVRPGGIYFIDDLLPQPNWPDGHGAKVAVLVEELERRPDFAAVKLAWASGLMLLARNNW